MRILMLISSPAITDPRLYNEARALIEGGHKVSVIAWDRYRQLPSRESQGGIDIIRLRTSLPPQWGLSVPPWHAFHLLLWQQQAYREALALNKKSRFDAIHCHFLDTMPVGIRLKRQLGLPLIYDARDMYGYMMQASFPRWIARAFEWLERRLVMKADRVIVVNDVMAGCFADMIKKPITVVMNCRPLQSRQYQGRLTTDKYTLLYIGTLHKSRDLPLLMNAVRDLFNVHCIIGGIGQSDYVEHIKKECGKIPNIAFIGAVPADMVLPLTVKADVIVSMFDPRNPNGKLATPNKLFEAMACGRPIICIRDTYCAEITEREMIGLAVEYSEEAFKKAIIRLRDDPQLREGLGRNALNAAITKYNWQIEQKKLLELYRGIHRSGINNT